MTMAFQNDSSGFIGLLSYMSIVYAYFFDLVVFHEDFNAIELMATFVILIVAVSVIWYKLRL